MALAFPFDGRLEINDRQAVFTKGYREDSVDADRMMDDFRAYCGTVDASHYADHVSDAIVYQADGYTNVRIEATSPLVM